MKKHSKELLLLWVLIIAFGLMSILSPDQFLSIDNLQSMASQLPEFGILALGMMIVIVTGGINLSLTSTAALSGIVSAFVLSDKNLFGGNTTAVIIFAIIVCLLTALACGLINGFLVSYIGVSSILVTLGTMTLYEGISLKFTKGGAISGFPESFTYFGNGTIFGIPVQIIIFLLVILVTIVCLENTPWGESVYMLGCNPKATEFSGINTKKVLMKVYLFSALLSGIAAIILISRYNSAKVDYGSSYLLQTIAASVLGGTAIEGGYGKVIGTVIATAILQVLTSGLNIIGVNRYFVDITMGCILILVLAINFFSGQISEKRKIKNKKASM